MTFGPIHGSKYTLELPTPHAFARVWSLRSLQVSVLSIDLSQDMTVLVLETSTLDVSCRWPDPPYVMRQQEVSS